MKSTQDLHQWMNALALDLEQDVMSVEIFTDKSFVISAQDGDNMIPVYDSSEQQEGLDINDLPYQAIGDIADIITAKLVEGRTPAAASPDPVNDELRSYIDDDPSHPVNKDA